MQVDLVYVSGLQIRMVLYSRHLFIRYITSVLENCIQTLVGRPEQERDCLGNTGIDGVICRKIQIAGSLTRSVCGPVVVVINIRYHVRAGFVEVHNYRRLKDDCIFS